MRSVIGILFERDKVKRVVRIGKGEGKGKRRRQVKDKVWQEYATGKVLEAMDRMEKEGVGIFADQKGVRKKRKV